MTTPPPGPQQPYTLAQVMPAQPKKKSKAPLIFAVLAVLALCGVGGAIALAANDPPVKPGNVQAPVAAGQPAAPAAPVEAPAVTYADPVLANFKLSVKTLEKQCFGSAGCNVTYRVDVTYIGTLDPAKTYRVTYEVRGVDDGPQINNFTVTGDTASVESEEFASTKNKSAKLTVKATDVTEE